MNCSVKGCIEPVTKQPIGSDKYKLCQIHYESWGWFRLGYEMGAGKDVGARSPKLWDKVMECFLAEAARQIVAFDIIAEAALKNKQ